MLTFLKKAEKKRGVKNVFVISNRRKTMTRKMECIQRREGGPLQAGHHHRVLLGSPSGTEPHTTHSSLQLGDWRQALGRHTRSHLCSHFLASMPDSVP